MATKSADKKHPAHVVARAAAAEEEVDPKEGVEFYTQENGVRIPVPDVARTFHPMEMSANPAVVAGTPSYLIDDTQPMVTSVRQGELMMLPDATQEERVEHYKLVSEAQATQLQAQIDLATEALAAMEGVSEPPPQPEPPEPEPTEEFLLLPQAAVEAQEAEEPAGRAAAKDEPEPGFPPPDDKKE